MAPITENIDELKRKIPMLEAQIEALSSPPYLIRGLILLGYLAFFGIVLPVLFLCFHIHIDCAKVIVMIAFCLGIFSIFVYVATLINTLRRKNDATS